MAKKKRPVAAPPPSLPQDKPATLKDFLNPEVLNKLKEQAEEWKAEEARKLEEERRKKEEERKAEQKRLEKDFEYLLNNSDQDWRKFK